MFAPPDFGGVSPPDASETRQAMMSGGDGFPQGFAASGCIGSSASGCQPTTNIYLTISAVVRLLKTNNNFKIATLDIFLERAAVGT